MTNKPNKLAFIPQSKKDYKIKYSGAGMGLMVKISVFLFAVSLVSWMGILLYKKVVSRQIAELTISVERAKASFDPVLISELERLGTNISTTKKLLEKHHLVSNIFKFLENSILENVRFTKFEYIYEPPVSENQVSRYQKTKKETGVMLDLRGEAKNFLALAQQSEVFENSEEIEKFSFSHFELTKESNVSFYLSIKFKPTMIFP